MKRTTIFVPEALERDLQLHARREGKATAVVVREALAAYIARARSSTNLPSFTGAFDSGHSVTAERHEDMLFRTLSPHGPRAKPRRKPASRSRQTLAKRRG